MNYKQQQEHYERLWKKVGNWKNESPNYKTRSSDPMILDFIDFLSKRNITKGNALDIGCGGGRHVIDFAEKGLKPYGLDYSKTAIKLARLNSKQKKVKTNFKQGDLFTAKYPNLFFDVIHDAGCLHHIKKADWHIYLNNLLKILKPNGYYFLFCMNLNTDQLTGRYPTKRKNWIKRRNHYTHFFTKEEINILFKKHFKILKIKEKETKKGRFFYITYLQKK